MTSPTAPAGPVFDWKLRHDPRSLQYKIADHFHLNIQLRSRHWTVERFLDQGNTPGCTGWSLAQIMNTTWRAWNFDDRAAMALYLEAQKQDEWPGENYDGSSVLGAQKAAKLAGYTTEYYWATTLEELKHGVTQFGPMQIGSDWYTGMMTPDSSGVIRVTGHVEGGHAYEVSGWDRKSGRFTISNTWSPAWGENGQAFIDEDQIGSLVFSGSGEAALPRKENPPTTHSS